MKRKGTVDRTLITGVIVALACVLAILAISIWQSERVRDTSAWVRHTNQVLFATEDVLGLTLRYELGVKNFLLTGNNHSLDSCSSLSTRIQQRLATLRELTSDNPGQQVRIDALSRDVLKNMQLLDSAIRAHQPGEPSAAGKLIANHTSTGYSSLVALSADKITAEESRLLEIRRTASRRRALELQYVLWGLIAAVVVMAFTVIRKMVIDLHRERSIKEQLSQFNKALEEQVKSKTADLLASEEKYKTLFFKSPLPKWIYDQDTLKFLEVNDAAVRHYGYTHDEFLNLTLKDIRPEEDLPRLLEEIKTLGASGAGTGNVWRHKTKDGKVIDVELTAHPIVYEGHRARMVIVSDITERMRSERENLQLTEDLKKRAAELSASNAELERFAYIASHDLQEPLRMVSSFLQLLQKKYAGQLDDKATQYIRFAVDGSERMKALILDLLEYSRVGTGGTPFAPVEMEGVVKEVLEVFREKIVSSQAHIELGPLPDTFGDRVQLVQLMQNLVGNALKYHSQAAPVITISGRTIPGGWQYQVKDNGIGIDPMFFEKIFIIFQRLHNKSDYSGTGIGLAVCKKIVERHGGRIWVESEPEKGSSFFFTILKHS